jgi:hypothetical protein
MARLDEDGMPFKNSSVDPSEPKRPATRFRFWVIVISLILAGAFLTVVVAIGIQHRNDRLLSAQLIQSEVELQTTGARIADIKDHKFKTMAEYVSAYAQIEPLLSDYDHKLQSYTDLCNRAQLRDERRTLINILRREKPYSPEIWRNASEIIQLVRQISSMMKKEASVIRGNWSQFVTLSGEETFSLGHSHWGNFRIRDRDIFGRALATGCALVPREKARQPYLPYLAKIEKYRGQTMRGEPWPIGQ